MALINSGMGNIIGIYKEKLPIAMAVGLGFVAIFAYGVISAGSGAVKIAEVAVPAGARMVAGGATGGISSVAEGAVRGAIAQ